MVRQVKGLATAVRYAALLALLVWSSVAARVLCPGMAAAAPWQESATPAAGAAPDSAPLAVFNRWIFTFRAPLGAAAPAERAAAAQRRVAAALQADATAEVRMRHTPEGALISIGDRTVFAITPGDIDSLLGESLDGAANQSVQRLRDAAVATGEQQNLRHTLRAGLQGLGACLALWLLLWLTFWIRRRARGWLQARTKPPAAGGPRVAWHVVTSGRAGTLASRLLDLVTWAAVLLFCYLLLTFVLTRFPYTEPWGRRLGQWLWGTVRGLGARAMGTLPGLATIALLLFLTRAVANVLNTFFSAVESGRIVLHWLHQDLAAPTRRLATAGLWAFAIVAAYPYVPGSDTGVFKGVSVLLGLMVTLGSSGVIGQAMSGFVLMYSRAFRRGDYVRIGTVEGTVLDLGVLSTKIQTVKQEMMNLPNSVVVGAGALNFSRLAAETGVVLHTAVTIGYDAPWRLVHEMLLEAARRTSGLAQDPAPFVLQRSLSDFYVDYEINATLPAPERRIPVLAELHAHIQDCFNENGVQIMSPHFMMQPDQPVTVPHAMWRRPRAGPPPAEPTMGA